MPKVTEQIFTRPPMERMLNIHNRIQHGKHPNCPDLASEFEVSTRTIKRDIDFMKYRLDLPIEYDARRYGYFYSKTVEQFPSIALSEQELFALLVAHKALEPYRGTSFEQPLTTAFQKLTDQLDPDARYSIDNLDQTLSFRPLAPDDPDLDTFQKLTQALAEHRVAKFHYRNIGTSRAKPRRVRPYHLACVDNRWYLFAHDLTRKAMRTFVLSRLSRLEITDDHFPPPTDFNPEEYLRGSFTVFKGTADYEIVLMFDRWAADLIRGRRWHATQDLTELPRGRLRMRLRLNSIEEMEGWILSWGKHVTVERPKELIRRIRDTAAKIHARYQV